MNCSIRRMLKLENIECPHKEQVGTCQYFCSPILVFDLCPYREEKEVKDDLPEDP